MVKEQLVTLTTGKIHDTKTKTDKNSKTNVKDLTNSKQIVKKEYILFANEYIRNGGDASKAYCIAFNKDINNINNSIYAAASRLLKNVKVVKLINNNEKEITKAVQNELIIDRTRQVKRAEMLGMKAEDAEDFGNALKALEIQNKLLGLNEEKDDNINIIAIKNNEVQTLSHEFERLRGLKRAIDGKKI